MVIRNINNKKKLFFEITDIAVNEILLTLINKYDNFDENWLMYCEEELYWDNGKEHSNKVFKWWSDKKIKEFPIEIQTYLNILNTTEQIKFIK